MTFDRLSLDSSPIFCAEKIFVRKRTRLSLSSPKSSTLSGFNCKMFLKQDEEMKRRAIDITVFNARLFNGLIY